MSIALSWDEASTPSELKAMLQTLGESYPVRPSGRGIAVEFVRSRDAQGLCDVRRSGRAARVTYSTPAQAARGVGALLSGLVAEGEPFVERTPFTMFGIMLDCSRNAVMKVGHLKTWLRRLALLGYNMVMLYTEDTYALEGEPWFGYQRGAYTAGELGEIDEYAARLGVEIIPCIQTLGHLEKILRHGAYGPIRDGGGVVLVDEPKTYELIEKMIAHWRGVCRTDRIHVGMDEAHSLGRGRYQEIHGPNDPFELFNRHLGKVVDICRGHGFRPMIWSDMYFRLGSKTHDYYDTSATPPKSVVERIPPEAEMVYWDYYHDDADFYRQMIDIHRGMGHEPLMGSGVWTWNKFWYDRRLTEANAGACIDACREAGVREIFFTEWGDNGAYCDFDSAFAGMAWCAERAYGGGASSESALDEILEKRFAAVCGGSYAAHILASDIHGGVEGWSPQIWDDPVFETRARRFAHDDVKKLAALGKGFADLARRIEKGASTKSAGDLRYAAAVAKAAGDNYALLAKLLAAYRARDRRRLRKVAEEIPSVQRSYRALAKAFRRMWMSHNKPEGMEMIQARFGMVDARYAELRLRIKELLDGTVEAIPELDYSCPPA